MKKPLIILLFLIGCKVSFEGKNWSQQEIEWNTNLLNILSESDTSILNLFYKDSTKYLWSKGHIYNFNNGDWIQGGSFTSMDVLLKYDKTLKVKTYDIFAFINNSKYYYGTWKIVGSKIIMVSNSGTLYSIHGDFIKSNDPTRIDTGYYIMDSRIIKSIKVGDKTLKPFE